MRHVAKVRYTDNQDRSHFVEVVSDVSDRSHIEDLVRAQFPAKNVYLQSVRAET